MDINEKIVSNINQHLDVVKELLKTNLGQISRLCEVGLQALQQEGKIIFMGNGGSAADSQHLAAEFVSRFVRKRGPLPALSLTTDTSILTSIGNDFGFEYIFERQIKALGNQNDMVVAISTSGNSSNIIKAIEEANKKGIQTIGLLGGTGGKLASLVNIPIIVSSATTARIQEAHILIGHILCEYCDEYFASHS